MEFINKGNFNLALEELKKDQNNAIASVFETSNKNNGILSNVVFTLKNNYAKNFDTTTSSSNLLEKFNPGYNATILDKLLSQGAQLVATTNLDEFGLGGTGTFSNKGIIVHPLDNKRLVGGSSSGSAATFTNNIGFAIGSDTGDSVRLPASNIGKVGFKPSYGAVSRYGLFAYSSSLDTVAWFTHNVNDSIVIANVLYGKDKKDLTSLDIAINNVKNTKPKKIAYLNCFDQLQPYVKEVYKKLLDKLKNENIELVEIQPDLNLLEVSKIVYEIVSFAEASSNLSNLTGISFGNQVDGKNWEEIFQNTRSNGFGFMVQKRIALGSYFLEKNNQQETFLRAQKIRRLISNWFTKIHDENDLFIYPASGDIAPLINNNDLSFAKGTKYINHILTNANLVGNPSLTLKLGEHEGMPFNVAIDAKLYKDEKLLSHSLFIEEILKK